MLDLHTDSQKEVYMRMVGTLTFYMLFGVANFHKSVPGALPNPTGGNLPPQRLLSKRKIGGLHVNAISLPATLVD